MKNKLKKLLFLFFTFLPFVLLAQVDSTTVVPDGDIFGLSWKWIVGALVTAEGILRILPIKKKWSIINLISVVIKLIPEIPKVIDKLHEKIPNNAPKMIAVLLLGTWLLSSCTGPQDIAKTKINGIELSGSKVTVDGTSHFPVNLTQEKIDSTIKAVTKDLRQIRSFKTDSTGTDVNWILTTPDLPLSTIPLH